MPSLKPRKWPILLIGLFCAAGWVGISLAEDSCPPLRLAVELLDSENSKTEIGKIGQVDERLGKALSRSTDNLTIRASSTPLPA